MSNTPLDFFCSSCGQELTSPPELFGKSLTCPACGAVLTVPNGPNLAQTGAPSSAPQGHGGLGTSGAYQSTPPPPRTVSAVSRPNVPRSVETANAKSKSEKKSRHVPSYVSYVVLGILVIFLIIPAVRLVLGKADVAQTPISKNGIPNTSTVNESTNNDRAENVSKTLIIEDLKSPTTAKFSGFKIIKAEHPYYQTAITVDAQNSYGAMIRTSFICVFQLGDGDKFSHIPGASVQKIPSMFTMDSLNRPDELLASILHSQRSVGGWPSSAQSDQPTTVDKSEPNGKNAKPPVGPVSPRPISTPVPSGTAGIAGSSAQEQTSGQPDRTATGPGESGKSEETDKNVATAPPVVAGPPDDIVRAGTARFCKPNEPYRRGETLKSLGGNGIPRDTLMYPIKAGEFPLPIYFLQDSFGDWKVFLEAWKEPIAISVLNPGAKAGESSPSTRGVGTTKGSTGEKNNQPKESKSLSELKGDLAVIETKIKSERQRWQQAENTIHRLTDNHHSYLTPGTPSYVQCEQATLVKDEIQKGAPDLNAEKARLEAMIKDLESK